MRLLICGGRHFNNYQVAESVIISLLQNRELDFSDVEIVSGHCSGADMIGERFAKENNCSLKIFPAEWTTYGRSAGPIRNNNMIDYLLEDEDPFVLAFMSKNSKGTKYTVARAKSRRIPVKIVEYELFEEFAELYEGITKTPGGEFDFDWENNTVEDIIKLDVECIHMTKFNKQLRYYGYKINKNSKAEDRRDFLTYVKQNVSSDSRLIEMVNKCIEDFYSRNNAVSYNYILKLPSRSEINDLMCESIVAKFDTSEIIELVKRPTSDLDFDWELFKQYFKGDYYDNMYKYLSGLIQTLKQDEKFSITKVSPRYRRYLKPMIDFGDKSIENSEDIRLLIVDDTFTTGSTINMVFDLLKNLDFKGSIDMLTLINNT